MTLLIYYHDWVSTSPLPDIIKGGAEVQVLQLNKTECFNYWRVISFHEIDPFHVLDKLTFTVLFYFQFCIPFILSQILIIGAVTD